MKHASPQALISLNIFKSVSPATFPNKAQHNKLYLSYTIEYAQGFFAEQDR
jgi:hypothetical protein